MARSGVVVYNGQEYSVDSDIGKIAVEFEQPHYRPEQNPYPRMMYKAQKCDDGIVRADSGTTAPRHMFANDQAYQFAMQRDDAFNEQCRMEIGRGPDGKALSREVCEAQHKQALENGWRDSAEEAIELVKSFESEIFKAAMKQADSDKGMTEKALRDARAAQRATPHVLAEIPEQPIMKAPKEHWKTRKAREERESREAASA